MRRSTRLRGREDAAEAPDATSKRQKTGADAAEAATSEKRAAWDEFLQSKCFLQVPGDFYDVFELAAELRPDAPCEAFVDALGVRLCGPFDLLAAAGKQVTAVKPLYLHGRCFFDPPEVAAVMLDSESDVGRHWGYFRDFPEQVPEYIVCAENSSECRFGIVAGSLFQVLESRLEQRRSTLGDDEATDLSRKIEARRGEKSRSRGQTESALRTKRAKERVAESLHQLGIVVPVNTKTNTGYRELPTTGTDLKDLLHQVQLDANKKPAGPSRKKLSELITRATIASDECDFGTGLLLGLDVFTAGPCLEKEALQLLRVAYMLLRRANFYKIASGHCKHRSQDDPKAGIQSIAVVGDASTDKDMKMSTVELPQPLAGGK